jgi:hypothetical protein
MKRLVPATRASAKLTDRCMVCRSYRPSRYDGYVMACSRACSDRAKAKRARRVLNDDRPCNPPSVHNPAPPDHNL